VEKTRFFSKYPKILSKKHKANANAIPIRFIPIPPLRFIEETETAIIVKMKAEPAR
jgi:hypothetical protein